MRYRCSALPAVLSVKPIGSWSYFDACDITAVDGEECIEDISRWREDISFMFEWQEQYLTSERREHEIHISELTCNVLFYYTY